MIIKTRPPGVMAYLSTGEGVLWNWELDAEVADVRVSIGESFPTLCTFPNGVLVRTDEALLTGERTRNDGVAWIGEAGEIVDMCSIFVLILNWRKAF
jgi:hypothetical protein